MFGALVAALLWNTAFCLLGYFVGSERERLQVALEQLGWIAFAVFVVAFVVWRLTGKHSLLRRLRVRRTVVSGR